MTGEDLPAGVQLPNEEATASVQVLIPQQYPGAFYYPPCKCDLVNQVRIIHFPQFHNYTLATLCYGTFLLG